MWLETQTHVPYPITLKHISSANNSCCLDDQAKAGKICILSPSLYMFLKNNNNKRKKTTRFQISLRLRIISYTSFYFPWCLTQCLACKMYSIHIFVKVSLKATYIIENPEHVHRENLKNVYYEHLKHADINQNILNSSIISQHRG